MYTILFLLGSIKKIYSETQFVASFLSSETQRRGIGFVPSNTNFVGDIQEEHE